MRKLNLLYFIVLINFLSCKKGESGSIGPQGPQGLTGNSGTPSTVVGPAGDKGLTGEKGTQGDAGAAGSAIISNVNATNWTKADGWKFTKTSKNYVHEYSLNITSNLITKKTIDKDVLITYIKYTNTNGVNTIFNIDQLAGLITDVSTKVTGFFDGRSYITFKGYSENSINLIGVKNASTLDANAAETLKNIASLNSTDVEIRTIIISTANSSRVQFIDFNDYDSVCKTLNITK